MVYAEIQLLPSHTTDIHRGNPIQSSSACRSRVDNTSGKAPATTHPSSIHEQAVDTDSTVLDAGPAAASGGFGGVEIFA